MRGHLRLSLYPGLNVRKHLTVHLAENAELTFFKRIISPAQCSLYLRVLPHSLLICLAPNSSRQNSVFFGTIQAAATTSYDKCQNSYILNALATRLAALVLRWAAKFQPRTQLLGRSFLLPATLAMKANMKCGIFCSLCFWVTSYAAPISEAWNRPAALDDEHSPPRSMVKMVLKVASSSPFTNEAIIKTTYYVDKNTDDVTSCAGRYATIADFIAHSNSDKARTTTDIECDIVTSTYSNKTALFIKTSTTSACHDKCYHIHRISLVGVRNYLAVFMLGFAVLSALACSYLRMSVALYNDSTLRGLYC